MALILIQNIVKGYWALETSTTCMLIHVLYCIEYALIKLIYYLAFPYSLTVTYISPSTSSHLIWSPAEKDSLIEWYHYLDKVMTWTILQSHNYDNKFCCSRKHPHPSHRRFSDFHWSCSQISPVFNIKLHTSHTFPKSLPFVNPIPSPSESPMTLLWLHITVFAMCPPSIGKNSQGLNTEKFLGLIS